MRPAATSILAAAVALGLAAATAVSAPEPRLVSSDWELDAEFDVPRRIELSAPGTSAGRTFWYVLYTVTNRTGADRTFVPSFALYTDTGQLMRDSSGVPAAVFQAIQARHNNPLLKGVTDMTGPLLEGADNAKDGVAIFSDIEPGARSFELFVGGLSGETAVLRLPVAVPLERTDSEGRVRLVRDDRIVLEKTLQLSYGIPGEPSARASGGVIPAGRRWVMR